MTTSPRWTFITNHGRVLSYIATHPRSTAREIALEVHVTERTIHKIISDLEQAQYVTRRREGRRNVYNVDPTLPLRHHMNQDVSVADLLEVLTGRNDLHELVDPDGDEDGGAD